MKRPLAPTAPPRPVHAVERGEDGRVGDPAPALEGCLDIVHRLIRLRPQRFHSVTVGRHRFTILEMDAPQIVTVKAGATGDSLR